VGKALFDVDDNDSAPEAGIETQGVVSEVEPEQSASGDTVCALATQLAKKAQKKKAAGRGGAAGTEAQGAVEVFEPDSDSDLDVSLAKRGGRGDQKGKSKDCNAEAGQAKGRQELGRGRGRGQGRGRGRGRG
jgi:hypothetical protein